MITKGPTDSDTLGGVDHKHASDEIPCVWRKVGWDGEPAVLDLLQEDADVFVVEGEAASEEGEENDTARPNVRSGTVITYALHVSSAHSTSMSPTMTISGLA
jgi:hypothetical protein